MESKITFLDDMEAQAADFNSLQQFAQDRDDHIVSDGIDPGFRFWGFAVIATGATTVTVEPGRLYKEGRAYARNESVAFDLFSSLPLVAKKIVTIVAYGDPAKAANIVQRDFLVDAETEETEPRQVALELQRYANLGVVAGTEAASPSIPAVDVGGQLEIARITLGTTGIVSVEMVTANRLPSVSGVNALVAEINAWRTRTGTQLDTLASDLASTAAKFTEVGSYKEIEALQFDVARMRELLDLPETYNNYGAEFFVEDSGSNTDRLGYDAEIGDMGLSFPADAEDAGLIALFNPYEARVKTYPNGLVIPDFEPEIRIQATGFADSASLTEYQVSTWALVKRSHTRFRTRYGQGYGTWTGTSTLKVLRRTELGPNSEPPGSKYPVAPLVFRKSKNGELETVFQDERKIKTAGQWRYDATNKWYRSDWWTEPYWTRVPTSFAVDGALRAQTFLNSQDGWLVAIGIYFVTKAASGDVHCQICETKDDGTPDLDAVLSSTTLALNDINVAANGKAETRVNFTPVLLQKGRRYAFVMISQGAHWVALANLVSYNGGSWFASSDGAYQVGSQTHDLKFNAYFASFKETWMRVDLDPLSLSGGIANIDLIGEGAIPDGTAMVYEIQASGGSWLPMEAFAPSVTSGPFANTMPPLLNFRAVLTGTRELMPAINLAATQQYLSRQKTALTWISEAKTLDAASDTFKVKLIANDFVAGNHTIAVTIEDAAAPNTWVAPDTTVDILLPDGKLERTMTWSLAAPATEVAFKIVGTTPEASSIFNVQEFSWIAVA